jgi:hypothetical protein
MHGEGRGEMSIRVLIGSPNVRDHWEDLALGGRITLRWILRR